MGLVICIGAESAGVSLWGHEGIYRDGQRVGYVTSGGIGHSTNEGRAIGMGYVRCDDGPASKARLMASSYELEVGGRRVPATPSWSCLYDPKSERPRSDLAA